MTILESLRKGASLLAASGVPDSRLDAELLLSHVLGVNRMQLLMKGREELSDTAFEAYDALIARRAAREPLQYILKSQSFMGFDLYVDESVLIPRPETELLCEHALQWLKEQNAPSPMVLDLCTGSGALSIALAKLMPKAKVFASDISEKALRVAQKNAAALAANVAFFQGDLLQAVKGLQFDLIVCNPPYIPTADCYMLQAEVLMEPRQALDGGKDGLDFYRRLAADAPDSLCAGGALFCEVGFDQAEAVCSLLSTVFEQARIFDDFQHIPRIVAAMVPHSLPGGKDVR